ncbi:MAG: PEGA domain-containing protein [Sandaracinaceae bacterium]|nr:PEGA domain-containing protein [Sandaracinaceae bacterium]
MTVFPWGEVWIDGRRHGRAPVSVRVPEGTHSVGVGRGSIEERRRVRVEAGQTGAVHVDLE